MLDLHQHILILTLAPDQTAHNIPQTVRLLLNYIKFNTLHSLIIQFCTSMRARNVKPRIP